MPDTHVPGVVSGARPRGAEPRREPAPARADRAGRRLDRRRGDRPRRPGAPRPAAGARAGRSASGSRSIMAWARGCSASSRLIAGTAGLARSLVVPGRAWAARRRRVWSTSRLWRAARPRLDSSFCLLGTGDRSVRGGDDPGLDAAVDRLRRPRISPARTQGVFPGRPDRLPAPQCLHEHAVRRGDAPPARRWR